jgi:hypothetical protein
VIAVVAVLCLAGVAAMLWYLINSQSGRDRLDRSRRRTLPPDDDPEFLAEIARRAHPDDD